MTESILLFMRAGDLAKWGVTRLAPTTLILLITCAVCHSSIASAAEPPTIDAGTTGRALPAADLSPSPFTIGILPDRTTGQPWGLNYLATAVTELNLIHPDAVFTIGDMVQGYTRSTEEYRREVEEYFKLINSLNAPYYPLPGNHDVISGYRNSDDHQFESLYQQYFGPLYYAVTFPHVTVLSVYTDEQLKSAVEFSAKQEQWIISRIRSAAANGQTIVMLMHKPAWRYRSANWDPIHQALAEAVRDQGVHAVVVAGHFHSMQRDPDRDGVQYHLVGTCGALIDQHPLTGQFQHLTLLKVFPETGETVLYHHPLGCTLPDTFVLAGDQQRANILKSREDVCRIESPLEQPTDRPVRGNVTLKLRNPIDRPVTFTPRLVTDTPKPTIVEGYGFVSRTQMDIFNPFVTNVDTPFEQVAPVEPVTLAPDEQHDIAIELRCEAQGRMLPPPQIDVTGQFIDDQGRTVPVLIRNRVPLRMRFAVNDTLALNMPISAWTFSVYDRRERDPLMGLASSNDQLNVAIAVFDDIVCNGPVENPTERVTNPASDAVIVSFGGEENVMRYLIEPVSPEHRVYRIVEVANPGRPGEPRYQLDPEPRITFEYEKRNQGFGLIIHIPFKMIGLPGEAVRFNVAISDNDLSYHTQWRTWSHPDAQSVIVLPARF